MALELFKNNITTTLAIGINSSATTITVASGTGSNFPALSGGNYFRAVLTSSAVPGSSYEYLVVTAVSGDNLTVIRGQEGVAAASWNAGDIIYMAATAASDANFAQAADLSGYAPIASPTFTGNPAGPTPAQFDNTTKLATTAFVQNALGNLNGTYQYTNQTASIPASYAGNLIVLGGTSNAITLPSLSSVPNAARFSFISQSSVNTILPAGSDSIFLSTSSQWTNASPFSLKGNDSLTLVSHGGGWQVMEGSSILPYVSEFFSSIAVNGYQKLPSGLILQWAKLSSINNNTANSAQSQSVTFPIAFPNAALVVNLGMSIGVSPTPGSYVCHDAESVSATGFTWWIGNGATGYSSGTLKAFMIAIGY